jgi:hypothetical protein
VTNGDHEPRRPTRALEASAPLPPMQLGRGTRAALVGLRLFIFLTTGMAIFTILHA